MPLRPDKRVKNNILWGISTAKTLLLGFYISAHFTVLESSGKNNIAIKKTHINTHTHICTNKGRRKINKIHVQKEAIILLQQREVTYT